MRLRLPFFICFLLWQTPAALAYYGVTYDPDHPSPKAISTLVPLNARVYRMTQPDGVRRLFARDQKEPSVLVPENGPWYGEILPRQSVVIQTQDGFKGGRTGFMFMDGLLRSMLLGTRQVDIPMPVFPVAATNGIPALWPDPKMVRKAERQARAAIWGDPNRWKFGFVNPNVAGALFACLAVAAASLLLSRRRWIVCMGALSVSCLLFCLAKTQSRSGFLAFFAGGLPLAYVYFRSRFTWRRILCLGVLLLGVCGCVWYSMAGRIDVRQAGLLNQASDTSRLPIWRAVPRMCATAPGGWGRGFTGIAYNNWFQPPERDHQLSGLLSSHFTRLSEYGWCGRFLYAFGWLSLLAVLWTAFAVFRRSPLPAAVWTAFFTAAFFNHIVGFSALWIVPLATLGVFALSKPWREGRAYLGVLLLAAAGTGGVMLCVWQMGLEDDARAPGPSIHRVDNATCINGERPRVWVVYDEYVLEGGYRGFFGKEVRSFYTRHPAAPALGCVHEIDDLPKRMDTLILAGKSVSAFLARWRSSPAAFPEFSRLVLLSPPFPWGEIPADFVKRFHPELMTGEFAARLAPGAENPPEWVTLAPGAELYVPGWMRSVLLTEANKGKKRGQD